MADVELVVKISEDLYKATVNGLDANEIWDLRFAVKNGTPLQKGHGDLIDRAELHLELDSFMYGISSIHKLIDKMKPIIEADKEQE